MRVAVRGGSLDRLKAYPTMFVIRWCCAVGQAISPVSSNFSDFHPGPLRFMKLWIAATLLISLPAWAQVAKEANREYQSAEGREKMGRNLEASDRDQKQKPAEIVAALDLKPGMTVADIGTGVGYMLSWLARAVGPTGKVLGEDIFPDFLDKCRSRIREAKLSNVDLVLGTETDPHLPSAALDRVLMLEVYHHLNYPGQTLAHIRDALKDDGRLVVVDFHRSPGDTHVRLDEDAVIREVEAAGFHLISKREHPSDRQYIAIFGKQAR